jgi:hypothetical protein
MSTLKVDNLQTTGGAGLYPARAWVTVTGATQVIQDSSNVSSITDNGTGRAYANFSTAFSNANYAKAIGANYANSATSNVDGHYWGHYTTSVRYGFHGSGSNSLYDCTQHSLICL